MKNFLTSRRPLVVNLILILGAVTLIALIAYALSGSSNAISNVYFISAFLLWVVAVIPLFTEVGGNTKLRLQARKEGKNVYELISEQEEKYQRGGRVTFLYGSAGFICFFLAFVVLIV